MRVRRYIPLLMLACNTVLCSAQPRPPSFCFVVDENGAVVRPIGNDLREEQHYRERVPYATMSGSRLLPEEVLPLQEIVRYPVRGIPKMEGMPSSENSPHHHQALHAQ